MVKQIRRLFFSIIIISGFSSCSTLNQLGLTPTEYEMITGLKDALEQGIFKGLDAFADPNGNPLVRFAFPGESAKIEQSLRDLGLASVLDKATGKFTRAMSDAAGVAKPMFISSLKRMSIKDAFNILVTDNPHAATEYFKTVNKDALLIAFRPIMDSTIKVENANLDWKKITAVYNLIPIQKPVLERDLTDFLSGRVIDGMFIMIGNEEENIRSKYEFRKTDMMKKVFAYADQQLKLKQG